MKAQLCREFSMIKTCSEIQNLSYQHTPGLLLSIWLETISSGRALAIRWGPVLCFLSFLAHAHTINWNVNCWLKKKKTSMLIFFFGRPGIDEPEHLRMRWGNIWTREKNAVPPDTGAGASYQTSHPGISARAIAFGRSWPFTAFCYRPCLPVRHWGRDMSAPKPYVTNPTPTHSSKPPLSI